MPSLIDIRRRIRSVKNTQQITKAMKMVSAAKLRRAQDRVIAARPYAAMLERRAATGDHARALDILALAVPQLRDLGMGQWDTRWLFPRPAPLAARLPLAAHPFAARH